MFRWGNFNRLVQIMVGFSTNWALSDEIQSTLVVDYGPKTQLSSSLLAPPLVLLCYIFIPCIIPPTTISASIIYLSFSFTSTPYFHFHHSCLAAKTISPMTKNFKALPLRGQTQKWCSECYKFTQFCESWERNCE